jgi:hypothetical protein
VRHEFRLHVVALWLLFRSLAVLLLVLPQRDPNPCCMLACSSASLLLPGWLSLCFWVCLLCALLVSASFVDAVAVISSADSAAVGLDAMGSSNPWRTLACLSACCLFPLSSSDGRFYVPGCACCVHNLLQVHLFAFVLLLRPLDVLLSIMPQRVCRMLTLLVDLLAVSGVSFGRSPLCSWACLLRAPLVSAAFASTVVATSFHCRAAVGVAAVCSESVLHTCLLVDLLAVSASRSDGRRCVAEYACYDVRHKFRFVLPGVLVTCAMIFGSICW